MFFLKRQGVFIALVCILSPIMGVAGPGDFVSPEYVSDDTESPEHSDSGGIEIISVSPPTTPISRPPTPFRKHWSEPLLESGERQKLERSQSLPASFNSSPNKEFPCAYIRALVEKRRALFAETSALRELEEEGEARTLASLRK
ncbi:MAG: hypothetical protein Q8Q25_00075 [bacterium]|nr:hypothetical protein [bacterium]